MLEVIVTNLRDALNAEKGGAHRLEIISHPTQEGLTPTIEIVKKIRDSVSIPFRVMIRDKNAFRDFSSSELENMARMIRKLSTLQTQGVVVGFLRENKKIDFDALQFVLKGKGDMKVTFHRAFDHVSVYKNSIQELIASGLVDRVLTSGCSLKAIDGINVLRKLNLAAGNKLTIIAGGSINAQNINEIKERTGIKEFHVGKAVRKNQNYLSEIDPDKVKEIVSKIN